MEIVDGLRQFGTTLAETAARGHLAKRARRVGVTLAPMAIAMPPVLAIGEAAAPLVAAVDPMDPARMEVPIIGDMEPPTPEGPPPAVSARIYRNQWIADCPDCHNAEFAWPEEPLFMCSECFNGTIGGQWRLVLFPNDKADIEAALRLRPIPHTRNWTAGEAVADLAAENREHGIMEVA